jgi:hypothetical protein
MNFFQISSNPNALVDEMENDDIWLVYFRRELDEKQTKLWLETWS